VGPVWEGYPNDYQDLRDKLPRFHGPSDSPASHISSFSDVISKLNINHKDVKMKMFLLSLDFLEDEIMDWYGKLSEGNISSLSYFFKIFLESWSPLYDKVGCEKLLWMLSIPHLVRSFLERSSLEGRFPVIEDLLIWLLLALDQVLRILGHV
jgi:hypothetical protein